MMRVHAPLLRQRMAQFAAQLRSAAFRFFAAFEHILDLAFEAVATVPRDDDEPGRQP
jgi:hypothetical protein